jgi:hypothetical protein
MRVWAFLIVLLLLPQAYAATFVDGTSGEEITKGIVRLEYDGTAQEFLLGEAVLPESTAEGLLVLIRGAGQTHAYYAKLAPGSVPQAVILHPGGLLMGEVRDSTDNLLVGTQVTISCAAVEERLATDATGRFRIFLPTGNCTVSVSADGKVGSATAVIAQGEVASLDLLVDRGVASDEGPDLAWLLWIIPLFIVLALLYWWKPKPVQKEAAPAKPEKRFLAADHKDALKEKELLVVDELLARDGSAKLAELRTATKIPRTSLLRCLEGLEQRGLLLKKEHNGKPIIELVKK